ncbi:mitochondrial carrier [Meredithblackwellia eburnea MCA 4105]
MSETLTNPSNSQDPTLTNITNQNTQRPAKRPRKVGPAPDSFEYALLSGFAGGIAGCVAKTSVAPLDRVKILFQTRSPDYQRYAGTWTGVFQASREIYSETGIRGLLQGHSATLLRIFPYAAIKFLMYERFHSMLMPTPDRETSARRFVAGSLAGVTSAMFTYPLELIRVRLAFESHHSAKDQASLLRTIRLIYLSPPPPNSKSTPISSPSSTTLSPSSNSSTPNQLRTTTKPSLRHFYRGIFPTLVGIVPYAGTSFLIWGFLKHDLIPTYIPPAFRQEHKTMIDLVAGGIAGAIGQTAAYPLDIVRRRMQVSPVLGVGSSAGFWSTAKGVWKSSGWRGFFVGLSIGYLKVAPMNAVSFATWVGLKRVFGLDDES